jgi:hypothetical protein
VRHRPPRLRDRRRCGAIERFEVVSAERVHEVIDDLDTVECTTHRVAIRRISGDPLDPGIRDRTWRPRDGDDVVLR